METMKKSKKRGKKYVSPKLTKHGNLREVRAGTVAYI
jgi:hypothetical protein